MADDRRCKNDPQHGRSASRQSDSRDLRPDLLKAAAIFAVVTIHAGLGDNESLRFCVPVFVGIWSYYLERSLSQRPVERRGGVLRSRLIVILAAYAFWTLIYVALLRLPSEQGTVSLTTVVNGWLGGYGWAGQYFFLIIGQLLIVTPLLPRGKRAQQMVFFASLAAMLLAPWLCDTFRLFHIADKRPFVYWLPYYIMGTAIARVRPAATWAKPALLVAIVFCLLAPWEADLRQDAGSRVMPYFLLCTAVSTFALLVWGFAEKRAQTAVDRAERSHLPKQLSGWAALLGRETFAIFTAHVLIIFLLDRPAFESWIPNSPIGYCLRVLTATAGAIIVGRLLQAIGLGIVVGKR